MENFYGIAGLWLCTVTNWWTNNWVSVAGVLLTVWFAWRAKTAAEQARDAAREARNRILAFDAVGAISAILEIMEEVKRFLREGTPNQAILRFATLCAHLVEIKGSPGLTRAEQNLVARVLTQCRIMETKIDRKSRASPAELFDPSEINELLSAQIDTLRGLRTEMRKVGM
jgi:hypothetical protein